MAGGYRVDLDELDAIVTRLRNLQKSMGSTATTATYRTALDPGELAGFFPEAKRLHGAHDAMKRELQGHIDRLEKLIDEFGGNTKAVADSYRENEQQTRTALRGTQGGELD